MSAKWPLLERFGGDFAGFCLHFCNFCVIFTPFYAFSRCLALFWTCFSVGNAFLRFGAAGRGRRGYDSQPARRVLARGAWRAARLALRAA